MDRIDTLKQERARVTTELRHLVEAAEADNEGKGRALTAEERQSRDRLKAAHSDLGERIADLDAVRNMGEARDRDANKIDGTALGHDTESRNAAGDNREYAAAFAKYLRHGAADMSSDERRTLLGGEVRTDMEKGTTTTGGYSVPQSFSDRMFAIKIQAGGVRQTRVNVFKTGDGRDFPVPIVTANGSAEWLAESTGAAIVAETLGQVTLKAYIVDRMERLSLALLADSAFDLESYLVNKSAQKIARTENLAYIGGSGSGQPTGMVSLADGVPKTAASITVPEVEYAAAAGPTSDEVQSSYYKLGPQYRVNAQWLLADSMIQAVTSLKATTGQYLWLPSLKDGEPDQLMGKPVINDPDLSATGTDEHVVGVFADFDQFYSIRDVNEVNVQRLNERYADSLQVGFLTWQRTDGHLIDAIAGVQLVTGAA